MPKTKPIRRSPGRIRKILADLEASGLSRAKFAVPGGIHISTIHSWVKKAAAKKRSDSPNVIPIGTLPAPATPAIEIELPSGEWWDGLKRAVLFSIRTKPRCIWTRRSICR